MFCYRCRGPSKAGTGSGSFLLEGGRPMLGSCLEAVRRRAPLIHCITNYVTANDVANLLLACGARPIMADDPEEAAEITQGCQGLVLNLGTLSRRTIPSMHAAGLRAAQLGHPVVLDPVGVGGSAMRRETARSLLQGVSFAAVRGNASELKALLEQAPAFSGVDACPADRVEENSLSQGVSFVKEAARRLGTVTAVTGAIDLVSDGTRCYVFRGGRPEMGKVTGTGCQLSALVCACLAANPERPLEAVAAAVAAMDAAGELAWARIEPGDGNAAYRGRILDAIYNLDGDTLDRRTDYEIQ